MLVLCSDDSAQIERWRAGLARWRGRYRVCGGLDALHDARPDAGDLILIDMELAAPERMLEFIGAHPGLRFFVFSSRHEAAEGQAVIAAGARGYANRYMHPDVLSRAVELVLAGEIWLGAELVLHLIRASAPRARAEHADDAPDPLRGLTPREREIAGHLVRGMSNKAIAEALGVAERTVKAHLGAIFRKTGTRDRLQLAMYLKDRMSG